MKMRWAAVFVVVLLVFFFALDDGDAARGRGGGSRSSGGRSSSKSRSKSKSSSSGSKSGSSFKPKITKYTPIEATTVRSPVIIKQTKLGLRSNTLTKVLLGYMLIRYSLATAPVYRSGYPMYGSYVSIPKKRAIRVTYEEQSLLDANGNLCLGKSSAKQTLRGDIDKNMVELNTTVKYKTGEIRTYHGRNSTVSLEDIKEEDFEVISRARYNTTIVEATSCKQVENKIRGTMIEMFETNPNRAEDLCICNRLLAFSVIVLLAAIF